MQPSVLQTAKCGSMACVAVRFGKEAATPLVHFSRRDLHTVTPSAQAPRDLASDRLGYRRVII